MPPRRRESYYERNRDKVALERFLRYQLADASRVPRLETLERHGLTPEDFNCMREEAGHARINFRSRFRLRSRSDWAGYERCLRGEERPADEEAGAPPSEGGDGAALPPEQPELEAWPFEALEEMIRAIEGTPRLRADGSLVANKMVTRATVRQIVSNLKRVVRAAGCTVATADMAECLRDPRLVREGVEADVASRRSSNKSTIRKTLYSSVVSALKYVPSFARAVGEERVREYQALLEGEMQTAASEQRRATEDPARAVRPIAEVKRLVDRVREAFGADSIQFAAAWLQANVPGFRDDLGDVLVVPTFEEGRRRKLKKFYARRDRRLFVSEFKTDRKQEPYDVRLDDRQAEMVERIADVAVRRRRGFLAGRGNKSGQIARAFETVAGPGPRVTINSIRHAQVIEALRMPDGSVVSEQRRFEVAQRFKHSIEMVLKYVRVLRGEAPVEETLEEIETQGD